MNRHALPGCIPCLTAAGLLSHGLLLRPAR